MKKRMLFSVAMAGLALLLFMAGGAFAGIAPSPFKSASIKLNFIKLNLTAIQKNLEKLQSLEPLPRGTPIYLGATVIYLGVLDKGLEDVISTLPDTFTPGLEKVILSLKGIRSDANSMMGLFENIYSRLGIAPSPFREVLDSIALRVTGYIASTDATAPSMVSLQINHGETRTPSNSVTLSLSATDNVGVTGYYASENATTPSAAAPGWVSVTSTVSYAADVSFTLSGGNGTKTVYVWFKDDAGNVSGPATASTMLSITGQIIYHPPTSERKYSYYHYIPESALTRNPVRVLLYAHGSPKIETYPEMEAFIRDIEINQILPSCENYGYALVIMVTPRNFGQSSPDDLMNTQNMVRWVMCDNEYNEPEYAFYKRPDLEFVKVINDFMSFISQNGYNVYNRVFMTGFSAGGVQSQRFPILHPDKVAATAIGGAPGFLYPTAIWDNIPLNYHVGINDINLIPGNTYTRDELLKIHHFVFVGGDDTNSALDHPDMYDTAQSTIIKTYFGTTLQAMAQKFSDYMVTRGQCTLKIYPGIGHVYTDKMRIDTFTFFDSVPTN
ncbi:MAG: hypothetical protein NTW71_08755 [Deltaproteobacteria bacterium]|nr:hypothetical protein [Deltaproteobacteria bacterium]